MAEEIKLPNYEDIIKLCVEEMRIKFKNYGNDWLTSDDVYWKERLKKEVEEYYESMTIDSEKRKLLNIINIAAMAHETADNNRGCRQHEATFSIIAASKNCTIGTNCILCHKRLLITNGIIREDKNIV